MNTSWIGVTKFMFNLNNCTCLSGNGYQWITEDGTSSQLSIVYIKYVVF